MFKYLTTDQSWLLLWDLSYWIARFELKIKRKWYFSSADESYSHMFTY